MCITGLDVHHSSGSEASSRVNDTWMAALTDLVANESSNIAILFMKEIEDGNAKLASPNLLSGEKELFPELTENGRHGHFLLPNNTHFILIETPGSFSEIVLQ